MIKGVKDVKGVKGMNSMKILFFNEVFCSIVLLLVCTLYNILYNVI